MKYKLEVSRYLNNDVIATSGHYSISGMTEDSYQLIYDGTGYCGWLLYGLDLGNGDVGFEDDNLTYLNEKGESTPTDISEWSVNSGKWFHYYEDKNKNEYYIYCNDESHHHK